jgi:hypothetical protein
MNTTTIYLVGIADSFIHLFTFLCFPLFILFIVSFISYVAERDFTATKVNKGKKFMKIFGIAAAISMILTTIIPSSKLLAAMIILPRIQESEVIKKELKD